MAHRTRPGSCRRGTGTLRGPIPPDGPRLNADPLGLNTPTWATSYTTLDLGVGKSIRNLPQLRKGMGGIDDRYFAIHRTWWRHMSPARHWATWLGCLPIERWPQWAKLPGVG